jgi:hypothetical protein
MPYLGNQPTASDTLSVFKYVATSSQTTFTGADADGATLSYDIGDGSCQVHLNGIKLDRSDITAENGTSVVLAACTTGDIIHIQATKAFLPSDAVSASAGGTFSGAVVAGAGATVPSGQTLTIASGATIANSGTATGFADLTAVADGSVGSPSIANSGDTNTGIYWPGADQLGLTTAGAAAMLIDATGAVTMPLQPAFLAKTSSNTVNVTGDGTNYTGIFGTEIFDQNSDFDGTSTFTAPVTGRYYLHGFFRTYGLTTSHNEFTITLTTSNRSYSSFSRYVSSAMDPSDWAGTFAMLCDMDAADTATVAFAVDGSSQVCANASNSHFGGWLAA